MILENTKKEELISIIIPVYGVEKYIRVCLESVLNQTYKNIEVIIVNDGTKDDSLKIIEEFLSDSRVKLINKENGGLSSARNTGITQATGDYILHVDGDDFISKDTCYLLIEKLKEEKVDIIIFDVFLKREESLLKWIDTEMDEEEVNTGVNFLKKYYFIGKAKNSIWNKLIKKDLYINNGIFHPEDISLGEDTATLPKLILNSHKIAKLNKELYYYRQDNVNSMMNQENKKILEYIKAIDYVKEYFILKGYQELFEEYENIFRVNIFYTELLKVEKEKSEKSKKNDYIIGWKIFQSELKKIVKDKKFKKYKSYNLQFIYRLYLLNSKIGDIFLRIRNTLIK